MVVAGEGYKKEENRRITLRTWKCSLFLTGNSRLLQLSRMRQGSENKESLPYWNGLGWSLLLCSGTAVYHSGVFMPREVR